MCYGFSHINNMDTTAKVLHIYKYGDHCLLYNTSISVKISIILIIIKIKIMLREPTYLSQHVSVTVTLTFALRTVSTSHRPA